MGEVGVGVGMLGHGFAVWRTRPGLMALGLVPAVIAAAILATGLGFLLAFIAQIVTALTPFAEDWPAGWLVVFRIAAGAALVIGGFVVAAFTVTALALAIGEPFYDRIWRAVEQDAGGSVPDTGGGFWTGVGDALSLIAKGVGVALLAVALGLVPVVGGPVAAVVAFVLGARLLADELSGRALAARGIDRAARRALVRGHRGRMLGFGIATQLCFLVPLGAVLTMPAAVAGSTLLARSLVTDAA